MSNVKQKEWVLVVIVWDTRGAAKVTPHEGKVKTFGLLLIACHVDALPDKVGLHPEVTIQRVRSYKRLASQPSRPVRSVAQVSGLFMCYIHNICVHFVLDMHCFFDRLVISELMSVHDCVVTLLKTEEGEQV